MVAPTTIIIRWVGGGGGHFPVGQQQQQIVTMRWQIRVDSVVCLLRLRAATITATSVMVATIVGLVFSSIALEVVPVVTLSEVPTPTTITVGPAAV